MYWFDTTLLALLAASALLGAWTGFVRQIARIVCVGLAVYASIGLHEQAAAFLTDCVLQGASAAVIDILAYGFVFITAFLVLHYVSRLVRNLVREADLDGYDRGLGALLSLGKMALVLGVVCLGMINYRHSSTQDIVEKSRLISFFADNMERIVMMVPEESKDRLNEAIFNVRDQLAAYGLAPR
jgi:uncharacterized membrane protein required for colicin V production